jgi:FAD/FMN-containing dehydrogenase
MVWDEAADDAANFAWLHEATERMEPFSEGYYVNEIDAANRPDRARGAFSDPAWERLQQLRAEWDPRGVFHGFLGW